MKISQEENGSASEEEESYKHTDEGKRDVKRMNVKDKIEAVIKAQEETERKRIEETKFCRMTVEQQEMFLARERQVCQNCHQS